LRKKRALAGVQYHPGEVFLGQAADRVGEEILVGERDPVHQPAVGIQGHNDAPVEIALERVLGERRDGMGVEARREAHLERDAMLDYELEEGRVLAETRPVPDPPGAARLQGLMDGVGAVAFARVTGARKAV